MSELNPMYKTFNTRKKANGFSIVESLVALLVLSVGMLGIAALYIQGVRTGRSSLLRTKAVNLGADLADRIRANSTAILAYAGGPADNNCVDDAAAGVPCTAVQMAAHDLLLWQADITDAKEGLPGGAGAVVVTPNVAPAPNTYNITITWTEVGEPVAPAPGAPSYVLTVDI